MSKALYTVLIDGKEVAGVKNPGKGETVELTDLQAEHALRIGHIENAVKQPVTLPVVEETPAPKAKGKGSASGTGEASGSLTVTE